MPKDGISADERQKVLAMFSRILNVTADHTALRSKLLERISEVVNTVTTKPIKTVTGWPI